MLSVIFISGKKLCYLIFTKTRTRHNRNHVERKEQQCPRCTEPGGQKWRVVHLKIVVI